MHEFPLINIVWNFLVNALHLGPQPQKQNKNSKNKGGKKKKTTLS